MPQQLYADPKNANDNNCRTLRISRTTLSRSVTPGTRMQPSSKVASEWRQKRLVGSRSSSETASG
jgi:hypothetical protein